MTYKKCGTKEFPTNFINRLFDNTFIPFDTMNGDYIQFKFDIVSGAELQDQDGIIMTQEQVNDFLKTIP